MLTGIAAQSACERSLSQVGDLWTQFLKCQTWRSVQIIFYFRQHLLATLEMKHPIVSTVLWKSEPRYFTGHIQPNPHARKKLYNHLFRTFVLVASRISNRLFLPRRVIVRRSPTVILIFTDLFSKAVHFVALPKRPSALETAQLLTNHVS